MRRLQVTGAAIALLLTAVGAGHGDAAPPALIAFASERDQAPLSVNLYPNAALYLMNGNGTNLRRAFRLKGLAIRSVSWSPDRTRVVAAVGPAGHVFTDLAVIDLHGRLRWLTRTRQSIMSTEPEWSPNGDLIAFSSNRGRRDAGFRIFTIRPDGSGLKQVSPQRVIGPARNPPYDRAPTWSPDGAQLAFGCSEGLCDLDLATGGLTQLATGYLFGNPAWSPDGTKIAFDRSGSGANGDIWTVDVATNRLRNLTNTYRISERTPAWSPDSMTIVYQRTVPGHVDIWSMRANGRGGHALAPAPGFDGSPAWAR